ncbi:MAG: ABC transporter substrate-binding protein [Clostridiales bacterium]|nr:ABC transporter substrate-binding protein [Clostridiales bacterium]MDD7433289.1 ABC transporter substrate-binding protein [Clostridiales bacterium]MDY3062021.1 ABC transporter substrate-binding protein [Eubacteriales bacterium]
MQQKKSPYHDRSLLEHRSMRCPGSKADCFAGTGSASFSFRRSLRGFAAFCLALCLFFSLSFSLGTNVSVQAENPAAGSKAAELEDGLYSIEGAISGGTGRAHIASPLKLEVREGQMTATLVWSSKNYSWMEIDGQRYLALKGEAYSTFEVPVSLDEDIPFQAETTAMSTPHVIDYSLRLDGSTLKKGWSSEQAEDEAKGSKQKGQENAAKDEGEQGQKSDEKASAESEAELEKRFAPADPGNGWKPEKSMKLDFAKQFKIDDFQEGYRLIRTSDGRRYLLVPEGKDSPEGLDSDIKLIQQPLNQVYIAATGAMCFFDELQALDVLGFSSLIANDWTVENARKAMEEGKIQFGGKYSRPDYEQLLANGCKLALESRMILHAPEVQEQLEKIGLTVFVDHSSVEEHPLGRMEWIRCYAAMLNQDEEAEKLMSEQIRLMDEAKKAVDSRQNEDEEPKSVAFFYINSKGNAVTRSSEDYISKLIGIAGGKYIFENLGDPGKHRSTVNMEMEKFYETARDADIVIYCSTIVGELQTFDELLALNPLLKEFKAVQNKEVWCTRKNLYQDATHYGKMALEFSQIFSGHGEEEPLDYLFKLK